MPAIRITTYLKWQSGFSAKKQSTYVLHIYNSVTNFCHKTRLTQMRTCSTTRIMKMMVQRR